MSDAVVAAAAPKRLDLDLTGRCRPARAERFARALHFRAFRAAWHRALAVLGGAPPAQRRELARPHKTYSAGPAMEFFGTPRRFYGRAAYGGAGGVLFNRAGAALLAQRRELARPFGLAVALFILCQLCIVTRAHSATVTTTALPDETLTVHDVLFSDPKRLDANGNINLFAGNAYDREANEIGVNKNQTNKAVATITPASVATRVQFDFAPSGIASVSPLQATQTPEDLTVTGVLKGRATLFPKRRTDRKLGVFVFTPFQRAAAFHIINDDHGNSAPITIPQAQALVQGVNNIWSPQANISMGQVSVDISTVAINLGPTLDIIFEAAGAEEQAVVEAARITEVLINLYFVKGLTVTKGGLRETPDPPGATRFNPATGRADVFINVNAINLPRQMAHEFGHALGMHQLLVDYEDEHLKYQLMWAFDSGGTTIAPIQGNNINPAQ